MGFSVTATAYMSNRWTLIYVMDTWPTTHVCETKVFKQQKQEENMSHPRGLAGKYIWTWHLSRGATQSMLHVCLQSAAGRQRNQPGLATAHLMNNLYQLMGANKHARRTGYKQAQTCLCFKRYSLYWIVNVADGTNLLLKKHRGM